MTTKKEVLDFIYEHGQIQTELGDEKGQIEACADIYLSALVESGEISQEESATLLESIIND